MSLIKWNPESSLFPNLSAWMEDFFADNGGGFKPAIKGVSIPAINVMEGKNEFKLDVAAPGFRKEDFKIEVNNGFMTISGETKMEKEDKDEMFTRREFSFNTFTRSFTLPENAKTDLISAKYTDGILHITLPKTRTEEKPVKTVPVG
jgi:HSP20 family protein